MQPAKALWQVAFLAKPYASREGPFVAHWQVPHSSMFVMQLVCAYVCMCIKDAWHMHFVDSSSFRSIPLILIYFILC